MMAETVARIKEVPVNEGRRAAIGRLLTEAKDWVEADAELKMRRPEGKSRMEQCKLDLLAALRPEAANLNVRHAIAVLESQRW
jgi:hypothetical protein